jgi:adenosylmethionine-8-amino-7-oxononanoate aminotransferase
MLASRKICAAIETGSGAFQHGHTYIGHATACAAALAVQQTIRDERLLDAAQTRGKELAAALAGRFQDHAHVGNIRGRGLFWGVELVADRASKTPFDPALKLHARVKKEAMARGLMCYPMGGTVDGRQGDHILLAPPFIIKTNQIEELIGKLASAIDAAIQSAKS